MLDLIRSHRHLSDLPRILQRQLFHNRQGEVGRGGL